MAVYVYWLFGNTLTHPGRPDIPYNITTPTTGWGASWGTSWGG